MSTITLVDASFYTALYATAATAGAAIGWWMRGRTAEAVVAEERHYDEIAAPPEPQFYDQEAVEDMEDRRRKEEWVAYVAANDAQREARRRERENAEHAAMRAASEPQEDTFRSLYAPTWPRARISATEAGSAGNYERGVG